LSLGVYGVEGQRGFSGPGKTGNYDELIPWDINVYVFQVVGSDPSERNLLHAKIRINKPIIVLKKKASRKRVFLKILLVFLRTLRLSKLAA